MAIRTASKDSVFARIGGKPLRNQVCIFWLEGRCNRNPCRYLHREALPSETQEQQPRKRTWRNPNLTNVVVSNSASNSVKKGSVGSGQQKVVPVVRDAAQKSIVRIPQPKQCKYWVTGNCVHGDKCKDLHSWFCGSGFTMLGKFEGHAKVLLCIVCELDYFHIYANTSRPKLTFTDFARAISGISLPSGEDKLYSSSKDETVRVWDCKTGQNIGCAMISGEVGCLVAEGTWLFAGFKNVVKTWNLQNQTEISLSGAAGSVCSIVVDEDKLFAGTVEGTIMVWKWNPQTNIP